MRNTKESLRIIKENNRFQQPDSIKKIKYSVFIHQTHARSADLRI